MSDVIYPITSNRQVGRRSGSELVMIENAGHSTADQGMAEAIVAAASRFADGA